MTSNWPPQGGHDPQNPYGRPPQGQGEQSGFGQSANQPGPSFGQPAPGAPQQASPGFQQPGPQYGPPGQQPGYAPPPGASAQPGGWNPQPGAQGGGPFEPGPGAARMEEGPRKKKRTGLLITVAVLVVALVAGGVFAVTRFLSPEVDVASAETVPDNVVAYAQVDLNPSGDQKAKALSVLEKLPIDKDKAQDDFVGAILEPLLQDSEVNYEQDIKPWLGDHAAVGVTDNGSTVVSIATKDKKKAEEFWKERQQEGGGFAYFFSDDTIVITESDDLSAVQSSVEDGKVLAKKDVFSEATNKLGDTGIASYWIDAAAVSKLSNEKGSGPETSVDEGYLAGSLRFGDNSVEVYNVLIDMTMPKVDGNMESAARLPGDTQFLFGMSDGAKYLDFALEQSPEVESQLNDALSDVDLTIDDLRTLLGESVVVAGRVDPNNPPENPEDLEGGIMIVGDAQRIEEIVQRLAQDSRDMPLETVVKDNTIAIAFNRQYAEQMTEGDLGGQPQFKDAVNPKDAQLLAWVDMTDFATPLAEDAPGEFYDFVRSIKTASLTSTSVSETEASATLKVTFVD